jgi:hypothetical protein
LFVAAVNQTGIRASLAMAAMLAFALSPLVQLMHSVGMIDHHFLEFTFVLLTIWLGQRCFAHPERAGPAVALGTSLGVAVAFHNGLFSLQLPVLACAVIVWLKGNRLPRAPLCALAASLLVATLIASLPSSALRAGMFEFALLSWFHVYIAACSAAVLLFLAWRQFTIANLVLLGALSAGLAVPILQEVLHGASFVTGELSILGEIQEVQSPFRMYFETWGPRQTMSIYSWLLVAAPILAAWFAWRIIVENKPERVFFAVWAVFGLGLLLTQYRLHYFGLFALFTGPVLILDNLAKRYAWQSGIALVAALGAILVAYQPSLRERLFIIYAPAGEPDYAFSRDLYAELEPYCEQDPGLVLASTNDGSAILFHTECSVLSNNFIMRAEDEAKIREVYELLDSTPEQLIEHQPQIKYLLLRSGAYALSRNMTEPQTIHPDSPLGVALLSDAPPPAEFESLHTVMIGNNPGDPLQVYARLFRINR